MSLTMKLRPGQRVFVDNAVVRNENPRKTKISIKNAGSVLREDDVITPAEATTPTRQLYLIVQMMYFGAGQEWRASFDDLLPKLQHVYEETQEIVEKLTSIGSHVQQAQFYDALKLVRDVIKYEDTVLRYEKVRDTVNVDDLVGSENC